MKIGIIYVGYQTEDYIASSLTPWIMARHDKLGGNEYSICAVSLPFKGFPNNDVLDSTIQQLLDYKKANEIDKVITEPVDIPETVARTLALKYLVNQGVDIIWQIDSDETYTKEQILNISNFVNINNLVSWFKINFKNYVFDRNTYMEEPFIPPRIYRVKSQDLKIEEFYADNNIMYGSGDYATHDISLSNMIIPQSIALVNHITWLSDDRSRKKVEYQNKRWGHCSFKWDYKNKQLLFDESYYEKMGMRIPKILSEDS